MPKNVKCKNCNNLKNHWCRAVIDSPNEDMERDCRHFVQKTNADRIRAMSDEELATFLGEPCECFVDTETDGCRECGNQSCQKYLLEWLKQPAEVDHES